MNRNKAQQLYYFYRVAARTNESAGRFDAAWACLEAAHVVGQRGTRMHVEAHWTMLQLAWRVRDWTEILGQGLRLPMALAGTWLWVPSGNTGRARVSAFSRAPLPTDLE